MVNLACVQYQQIDEEIKKKKKQIWGRKRSKKFKGSLD